MQVIFRAFMNIVKSGICWIPRCILIKPSLEDPIYSSFQNRDHQELLLSYDPDQVGAWRDV